MDYYKRKYGKASRKELIGEVEVQIPIQPIRRWIAGTEFKKSQQYWRRTEMPKRILGLSREELASDPFVVEDSHRCREGYWFMNNGVPTYITGDHYFFLQWWVISGRNGYPGYRDCDRADFLFWDHCKRDKNCFGQLYIKPRREGATTRAGCKQYRIATSAFSSITGIQSKTSDDAKKVFREHIVRPWQRLPQFHRPIFTGSSNPKEGIDFSEPGEMNTHKKMRENESTGSLSQALNSEISYRASNITAYDGYKLTFYFCDEFGKTENVDILKRHEVVRECLVEGSRVVGKATYTSTIEDMGGDGLMLAQELWSRSDPSRLDGNGQTMSGLYRYFKPAYIGYVGFIDKYGNSDQRGAREFHENKRDDFRKRGDYEGLVRYMRKYPFTPEEAFTPNSDDCLFNVLKLTERGQELDRMEMMNEQPYVRGNLAWKDGKKGTEVVWLPNENGKFKMAKKPIKPNNVTSEKDWKTDAIKYKPGNSAIYKFGIDPYDYGQTTSIYAASKGAGVIYARPNIVDPDEGDRWVMMYVHRPPTNFEFYEDMVMMVHYYGCDGVLERNKDMCRAYFAEAGYRAFVMGKLVIDGMKRKPKMPKVEGEYTQRSQLKSMTDVMGQYIQDYSEKIDFVEIINSAREWRIDNSTKHDIMIATGYSLLASMYSDVKPKEDRVIKESAFAKTFYRKYKYKDNQSY